MQVDGLQETINICVRTCAHATQNERLPLRVVVQVFFEQVRCGASGGLSSVDISGAIHTLLPPDNGGSIGSSRTATTNTEEDWDDVATISDDLRSTKRELEAMRVGGGKRGGGGDVINTDKVSSKMRGILKSSRIFGKLLSHNQKGENSISDTSESPGSVNPGETKSTPSRNIRRSISREKGKCASLLDGTGGGCGFLGQRGWKVVGGSSPWPTLSSLYMLGERVLLYTCKIYCCSPVLGLLDYGKI